jgi:hypothetical protein
MFDRQLEGDKCNHDAQGYSTCAVSYRGNMISVDDYSYKYRHGEEHEKAALGKPRTEVRIPRHCSHNR